jgi:hypothetical protein
MLVSLKKIRVADHATDQTGPSKRQRGFRMCRFGACRLIRINILPARHVYHETKRRAAMIGITLTTDQIRKAPPLVRQWIEHEVIASLGLAADAPVTSVPPQAAHLVACTAEEAAAVLSQIQGVLPAVNVFFEFARPGVSYGQPAVMTFRLIDILHHTKLQNVGQVLACLDMINQALARVRSDPSVRFCGFDNEGHCFIAPDSQQSIAQLWRGVIASQHGVVDDAAAANLTPAA